ncbi:MAG: hypothetical protein ACYDAQ_13995 [Mycobacteriales bacterium]
MRRWLVCLAVAVLAEGLAAGPALAGGALQPKGHHTTLTGYDISYPQCGGAFPTGVAFGIVGVNDGIVYSPNPCLGTGDGSSELGWAQAAAGPPAFYANTADPGPAYSTMWPIGQTSPQSCATAAPNSPACSYDYGYNAAQNSFADATTAESQLGAATPAAAAAGAPWWLDVENANSWESLEPLYGASATYEGNDSQALAGEVAYLTAQGVTQVGVYSTSTQWQEITGGGTVTGSNFSNTPVWIPGARTSRQAANVCTGPSFTGGKVLLAQYPSGGFDADLACG